MPPSRPRPDTPFHCSQRRASRLAPGSGWLPPWPSSQPCTCRHRSFPGLCLFSELKHDGNKCWLRVGTQPGQPHRQEPQPRSPLARRPRVWRGLACAPTPVCRNARGCGALPTTDGGAGPGGLRVYRLENSVKPELPGIIPPLSKRYSRNTRRQDEQLCGFGKETKTKCDHETEASKEPPADTGRGWSCVCTRTGVWSCRTRT